MTGVLTLSPPTSIGYENHFQQEVVMKVRNSLRSLKDKPGAQVVRRRGKTYVINKKEPRFKARQG